MKRSLAVLALAAGLCTSAAAQDLAPSDRSGAFKTPPTPLPVPITGPAAPVKEPTFAAMSYGCYGDKELTHVTDKSGCLPAHDWSNLAEKRCANHCVKIPRNGKKPLLKCGVNGFGLDKACN